MMENGFIYQTPLGTIVLTENGSAITRLLFSAELPKEVNCAETPLLKKAAQQLQEYFAGTRKRFDLPLEPQGTDFQQKVWQAIAEGRSGLLHATTGAGKTLAVWLGALMRFVPPALAHQARAAT